MGLDDFASADPSGTVEQGELPSAEDLFDFDELVQSATEQVEGVSEKLDELLASAPEEEEEEQDVFSGGGAPKQSLDDADYEELDDSELEAVLGHAPTGAENERSHPNSPRTRDARLGTATAPSPPKHISGLSTILSACFALLGVLNVVLVVFTWKSFQAMRSTLGQVGDRVVETADAMRAETAQRVAEVIDWNDPNLALEEQGFETLELARRDMDLGDWRGSRQRLYALLSVVDRIDEAVRIEIESRARLMIAEGYRLEADALEGEGQR